MQSSRSLDANHSWRHLISSHLDSVVEWHLRNSFKTIACLQHKTFWLACKLFRESVLNACSWPSTLWNRKLRPVTPLSCSGSTEPSSKPSVTHTEFPHIFFLLRCNAHNKQHWCDLFSPHLDRIVRRLPPWRKKCMMLTFWKVFSWRVRRSKAVANGICKWLACLRWNTRQFGWRREIWHAEN